MGLGKSKSTCSWIHRDLYVKGNKNCLSKCIKERKRRVNMSLLLNTVGDLVPKDSKRPRYLIHSLLQSSLVKLSFRNPSFWGWWESLEWWRSTLDRGACKENGQTDVHRTWWDALIRAKRTTSRCKTGFDYFWRVMAMGGCSWRLEHAVVLFLCSVRTKGVLIITKEEKVNSRKPSNC